MRFTTIFLALFGAFALPALSDTPAPTNNVPKGLTIDQVYEMKFGGRLKRAGTGLGSTGFINVGTAVEQAQINRVIATLGKSLMHKQKSLTLASLDGLPTRATVDKLGISVGVFVVSDAKLPPMLVAPEDRWALVNVAKLNDGLRKDAAGEAAYNARCRGELQRAFFYVAGCGSSQYDGNLMCVNEVVQLDNVNPDLIVMDAVMRSQKYLKSIGVTLPKFASYKKACEEGWAPAPTNDIQKAIWDKIHAIPDKPMKIKFDPAAQKGKVTK